MRKRVTGRADESPVTREWLDLAAVARVEVTSEDPAHPVEAALVPGAGGGWRASGAGGQTIRLLFDRPTALRIVRLVFREEGAARTHEFTVRWSADGGTTYRDVVRQQYTFSPPGTIQEVEEYATGLDRVTALEVRIVPDVAGGGAPASLAELRLA